MNLSKTNIVILGLLTFALVLAIAVQFLADEPTNSTPEQAAVAEYKDLIKVTSPLPGSTVSSPLVITGEARGMWMFEASFPIVVVDWDGLIIGEGFATADGEWMTEEYVPFTATVTFDADTTVSPNGALILQKSNASGLPEHDDAFEFPVVFGSSAAVVPPQSQGTSETELAGTSWTWVTTEGAGTTPTPGAFVLSFDETGERVSSKTDCNTMNGSVTIDGVTMAFGPMMTTLMYCEGSQETEYGNQLSLVNSYARVGNTLRLNLLDASTMVFEQN